MSDAGRKIIEGLKAAVAGNLDRVHIPDEDLKLQTWVRIRTDVVIPRAQYEALMEAATRLLPANGYISDSMPDNRSVNLVTTIGALRQFTAALRAAGINLEIDND